MLLELLCDFQISIPELGRIEARTHPVVLLTSNNSRELTEALKRRCLYLWLDYPTPERELEIVHLHAPDLPETVAQRLVEVVAMVRELDLKKPPSIAESIDWARALLLLGAQDIDQKTFRDTLSIIVKHRTDLDTVAERVGVRLAAVSDASRPPDRLRGRAPHRGGGDRDVRAQRRLRRARRGRVDARPAPFKEALAATMAKSPDDRRVFDLVFERYFFRATEGAALESGVREGDAQQRGAEAASGSTSTRCASRSSRRSAPATRPRCAIWPAWRSPPSAAAARAPACSASTSSASAARSA